MTKILVVDDEIETLNLLKTILEISGFEVITTLNSVDAITLAEIEKPDVVLPDIMMPEMDGFTLCKLMREHRITKDLPIIFVTAYTGNDLDDRSQAAGADHVIKKPINIPELVAAIRKTQALREKASAEASMVPLDHKPEDSEHADTSNDDGQTSVEQVESSSAEQSPEKISIKQDKVSVSTSTKEAST